MFRELFLPTDADLLAEEEARRAVNRARRAQSRRRQTVTRLVTSSQREAHTLAVAAAEQRLR